MKLQSFSVIFALIVIPLILVLTYYVQLQVDTISLQNEYDTKLLAATYDAMSAFEINTANEDLSSVSDSLRTILEASSNIFINTLATNLGRSNASKALIEPYIPALLYTLYDGYYIYAPTKVPTVLTDPDGNAVSVGDPGVEVFGTSAYRYTPLDLSGITDEEEKQKAQEAWNSKVVSYDDLINKGDYGQLLYLKEGTTDQYTANISEANLKTKNVLKTYMPYSARYVKGNKDITIVYTLDNYVTIEGSIDDEYYTKSGYLIPADSVTIDMDGMEESKLLNYNQNSAQELLEESGKKITVKISDGTTFEAGGENIKKSVYENEIFLLNNQLEKAQENRSLFLKSTADSILLDPAKYSEDIAVTQDTINSITNKSKDYSYDASASVLETTNQIIKDCTAEINIKQYELDKISAAVYYTKAKIFSTWVLDKLSDIEEKDLIEIGGEDYKDQYKSINGTEEVIHDFSTSTQKVFNLSGTNDNGITEIHTDSPYYTHKLNVIRNSIQYNLNLTMSIYNKSGMAESYYEMPVISNEQWERILSNVSMVSFMQGLSCGLKQYSNYMITSSTNNEISILPEHIYYVEKTAFNDENSEYHKINCPKFIEKDKDDTEYIAFVSKEVKYDKLYDKTNTEMPYEYDHKNLACYECINDGNYEHQNIFTSTGGAKDFTNLRKAYYIAVGKSRNNIYKMNAVENSQGFEIIWDTTKGIAKGSSTLPLGSVKAIEIGIGKIDTSDRNETTASYTVGINGTTLNESTYTIPTNSTRLYTIVVEVDPNKSGLSYSSTISKGSLKFTNLSDISTTTNTPEDVIKYVRIIYK